MDSFEVFNFPLQRTVAIRGGRFGWAIGLVFVSVRVHVGVVSPRAWKSQTSVLHTHEVTVDAHTPGTSDGLSSAIYLSSPRMHHVYTRRTPDL